MPKRPTPTNLKVMKGTDRPDRVRDDEPQPVMATVVDPPTGMRSYGKRLWRELMPVLIRNNMLCETDHEVFAALCHAYDRYERARRRLPKVEKQCDPVEELDVIRRAEVSVEKAENAFRILAIDFGLTPASRTRIGTSVTSDDNDSILDKLWSTTG